ncbi:MAG: hypothetical protein ACT4PP_00930 [Sporichthyaceae bacterium]
MRSPQVQVRSGPFCDESDLRCLPVQDVEVLSIGGGLGSFALIDVLRVLGIPTGDLRVAGPDPDPALGFRHLAHCSQLRDHDRLRSDSGARIDNIWGFPGYALEEAIARRSPRPLLRVLGEPMLCDPFAPVSGHVYHGVAREAARIGWPHMHQRLRAQRIRLHRNGGLVTFATDDCGQQHAIRARAVHLALGYPALGLTRHLRRFRGRFGEFPTVVHAYEPHEQLYASLPAGANVLVCGAGATAARVIERLSEGGGAAQTRPRIIHLVRRTHPRSTVNDPAVWNWQHYTVPKGAFGGQLATHVAHACTEGSRHRRLRALTAPSAPPRAGLPGLLTRAAAEGRYRAIVGEIHSLEPADGDRIRAQIRGDDAHLAPDDLLVDAVIDCTGLVGRAGEHGLLADLVATGLARENSFGRLTVSADFEVREARHGQARIFASGAMSLGTDIGPVDSYWGLQAAALRIADALAASGMCRPLTMRNSLAGWVRWMRGVTP